jgi:hypothetical protein
VQAASLPVRLRAPREIAGGPSARGWIVVSVGGTLGEMHPIGVASAAWVFASAPSKVPFYVAGGSLAGWAVLLGVTGLTHPDFPGSAGLARLVMLTSVLLVAATITTAVLRRARKARARA